MAAHTQRPERRRGGSVFLVFGVCLILVGLGFLGYVGWQYYGTNVVSAHKQEDIKKDLKSDWSNDIDGDATGLVRIPKFGDDYEIPLDEGFDHDTLAQGIGWYPDGVGPGDVGNFVMAAHVRTRNEPFRHMRDLEEGDKVIVETRTDVYTYKLRDDGDQLTVDRTEGWPMQPVPEKGHAGESQTDEVLTMVTCRDMFHSPRRSIVFGDLVDTQHKNNDSQAGSDE